MTSNRWPLVLLLASAGAVSSCGGSHGPGSCAFNSDCPMGHSCMAGTCVAGCTTDAECVASRGAGSVCTTFGVCAGGADAGGNMDAAMSRDAGGMDVGNDAAMADTGPPDAGPPDAGPPDTNPPDVGSDAPSCTDGITNGSETDTDCGGGECPACGAHATCGAGSDCASSRCAGGHCAAMCGLTGLLLYLPFDSDTLDHSGAGHDATGANVTSNPSGAFGAAAQFNGTSSVMHVNGGSVPTDGGMTPGVTLMGARSLCAWLHPTTHVGGGQPVFVTGTPGQADFYSIQSSTPAMSAACATASVEGEPFSDHWGTACLIGGGLSAPSGTWSHVCYVHDATNALQFYVNGAAAMVTSGIYTAPLASLTIGSSTVGGSTTATTFSGSIDEVTVWSRALSATEIATLYDGGLACVP